MRRGRVSRSSLHKVLAARLPGHTPALRWGLCSLDRDELLRQFAIATVTQYSLEILGAAQEFG